MTNRQRQVILDLGHSRCYRLHGTRHGARGPQLTWSHKMADEGIEDCPGSVENTRGWLLRGDTRCKRGVKTTRGRYVRGIMYNSEGLSSDGRRKPRRC